MYSRLQCGLLPPCEHIAVQTSRLAIPSRPSNSNRTGAAKLAIQSRAGLSYRDAGVDIDAGAELVKRIQKLNPSIGGFSGMVPFGEPSPEAKSAGKDTIQRC